MANKSQRMFFQSEEVDTHWDTWMFHHAGTYYLYYLITEHSPGEGFGLATSDDGVSWSDHGWVVRASDKMVEYLGTGAVWPALGAAHHGRFLCNYSEWRDTDAGRTQNILFACSDDLIHWTKYGDGALFQVDARWYDPLGRWDCIYPLPRPEGGYFGYWTATPRGAVGFGVGESDDGLHWRALPAPVLLWGAIEPPDSMEAGATEEFAGRYYAMTGQPGLSMRTMVADHPTGPFQVAVRNYGLLENSGPHKHTYFARFVRTPGGVLVNHQAITRVRNQHNRPICYFAPLKLAYVDHEGTLWLRYWVGNDRLKARPVEWHFGAAHSGIRLADELLDVKNGIVLEGKIVVPRTGDEGSMPGLYIECAPSSGAAIHVGSDGVTRFGLLETGSKGEPGSFLCEDIMAREWTFGDSVRFRLLLKESVLEFYLDDLYIQSYSLPAEATGRIGLLGAERILEVTAWQTT